MNRTRKYPKPNTKNLSIRRLSTYLRTLDHLEKKGVDVVSSSELERIEGISQCLIRRDFAEFGSFGVRGVGYSVSALRGQISEILGFNQPRKVVLIGAGGFGSVLMHSEAFRRRHLEVVQIFDNSSFLVGKSIEGILIHDLERLEVDLHPARVDIALIALSPPEVQGVIDRLGQIGVRGVLYFASRPVSVPEHMTVINVDITVELGVLMYHLCGRASG